MRRDPIHDEEREARIKELMDRAQKQQQRAKQSKSKNAPKVKPPKKK